MFFNKLSVTIGLVIALAISGTAKAKDQEEAAAPAIPAASSSSSTFVPSAPAMREQEIKERCLSLFGKKVQYLGSIDDMGTIRKDTTFEMETKGEVVYGPVSKRNVCLLNFSWWNARQEGARNFRVFFDGKHVVWIDPKYANLNIAFVISFDESGSRLQYRKRYLLDGGGAGVATGDFTRR